jgi:hypothetical protein
VQLLDDLHAHGKSTTSVTVPGATDTSEMETLAVPFAPAHNGHQRN